MLIKVVLSEYFFARSFNLGISSIQGPQLTDQKSKTTNWSFGEFSKHISHFGRQNIRQ